MMKTKKTRLEIFRRFSSLKVCRSQNSTNLSKCLRKSQPPPKIAPTTLKTATLHRTRLLRQRQPGRRLRNSVRRNMPLKTKAQKRMLRIMKIAIKRRMILHRETSMKKWTGKIKNWSFRAYIKTKPRMMLTRTMRTRLGML